MASTIDFNQSPYFDDFEDVAKDKNFHRILFKPGLAVQARELTQLQSILQNQIERFGFNVFKEGSEISGASTFLDNTQIVRLDPSYGGATIDVSTFEGQYARSRRTELLFYVKKVEAATSTEKNIVHLQFLRSANSIGTLSANNISLNGFTPRASEVLDFSANGALNASNKFAGSNTGAATIFAGSASQPYSANGLLFHVDEGIFFTNGNFVRNTKQSIPISSNTNVVTSVGFDVTESIVNSDQDNTLLDNARGSYNFTAPGADRYKINLNLTSKIISDVSSPNLTTTNYIEVARVRNGTVVRKTPAPNYNTLQDVLAERTFDESGNYIVRGLNVNVTDNNSNTENLTVEISPGRAYVKGYQVNNLSTFRINMPRSRETESVTEQTMTGFYGNFVNVKTLSEGAFDIQGDRIELHANTTPADAPGATTKIGEAYVKNLEYSSGTGSDRIYKLFLYDVKVTHPELTFDTTESVIVGNASSFTAKALVDDSSITTVTKFGSTTSGANTIIINNTSGLKKGQLVENGTHFPDRTVITDITFDTITVNQNALLSNTNAEIDFKSTGLSDTEYKTSVFPLPNKLPTSVTNVDYKFKRKFATVQFTNGVATIQTDGATERFSSGTGSLVNENFFVIVKTGGTGSVTNGLNVDMTTGSRSVATSAPPGSPGTATIDVDEGGFNGTCDVIATIDVTGDSRRVKTFANNQTKTFEPIVANTLYSLGFSDVIRINNIYEGNSTSVTANDTVVTTNFIFDTGQRDNFYDHATIKLKPGLSTTTGKILVDYDRFDHAGGRGFFVADSYPDYNNIPAFTNSKGENISLRDSIDFRPIRTANASSNLFSSTSKLFDQSQIVDSQTYEIELDYNYYLARNHKLSIDQEGNFRLNAGASKLKNPPTPSDDADSMTLAEFKLKPYTFNSNDMTKRIERNVRYTMKDIGNLEKRIQRVEEITSLNLLENQVNSQTFIDENGSILFKSGFVVDSFNGHGVGDIRNNDYRVSIDRRKGVLHPSFTSDSVPLVLSSRTLTKTGDYLTLPFNEVPFLNQNTASRTVNINPFHVSTFVGHLKLTPDTDIWLDFESRPVIINNENGNLDNFSEVSVNTAGTEWGEWERVGLDTSVFEGSPTSTVSLSNSPIPTFTGQANVDKEIIEQTKNSINDEFYFFMRSRKVDFVATGMRPNTRLYIFIDGIGISQYSGPSTLGADTLEEIRTTNPQRKEIVTDESGKAEGFFFIPNDSNFTRRANTANILATYENLAGNSFKLSTVTGSNTLPITTGGINILSGTKPVLICDNNLNTLNSSTYAIANYTSQGRKRITEVVYNGRPTEPPVDTKPDNDTTRSNSSSGSTGGGSTPITTGTGVTEGVTVDVSFFSDSDATRNEAIANSLTAVQNYVDEEGLGDIDDLLVEDVLPSGGTGNIIFHDPGDGRGVLDVAKELVNKAFGTEKPSQDAYEWVQTELGKKTAGPSGKTLDEAVRELYTENVNAGIIPDEPFDVAGFTITSDQIVDNESPKCLSGEDPLAQTFFVSEDFNPKGIFVTSVELFFSQKDENLPVRVEIRPTVNGFPSSEDVIPLTRVSKNPSEVNIPTDQNNPVATKFTFDAPVHLLPGEYAIVVKTDSINYLSYISRIGDQKLGTTDFINSQPTLGSLFKSQNARTWTPAQDDDLCFRLNRAQFTTDTNFTAVFNANNEGRFVYDASSNTVGQFDVSVVNLTEYGADDEISTSYELQTRPEGGSLDAYAGITPNQTIFFDTEKRISADSDLKLRVTYSSRNSDISPYLDTSVASASLIKNLISPLSSITGNPETNSSGGGGLARYITRKVTLAEGFNASTLKVLLSQNMPKGSAVQVYYKVLNENDTTAFDERGYVQMTRVQTDVVTNEELTEFNNYEYIAEGITYTQDGTLFNNFNQFAIKIVMFADNSALSPTIRNFRAIAFA